MSSQPWLKFYTSDWQSDHGLRSCSIAARGLWIEILCIMHKAEPTGHLLVNGKAPPTSLLARLCGTPERQVKTLLAELRDHGVFDEADGVIVSRRMVRDAEKAVRDKANGRKGGNPKVKAGLNGGVNPPVNGGDKAQKPEARSQKDSGPDGPAAGAAEPDYRDLLWTEGADSLARQTGKTVSAAKSFIGKCLKEAKDDARLVLTKIRQAEADRVTDPAAWISAAVRTPKPTDPADDMQAAILRRMKASST